MAAQGLLEQRVARAIYGRDRRWALLLDGSASDDDHGAGGDELTRQPTDRLIGSLQRAGNGPERRVPIHFREQAPLVGSELNRLAAQWVHLGELDGGLPGNGSD